MKGVVLAGGRGTRLGNLTRTMNKHLLPVFREPMVCHALRMLSTAGIRDVIVVLGGNQPGELVQHLGGGHDLGLEHISYVYQEGHDGVPAAIALAREFVMDEDFVVVLGDNVLPEGIAASVAAFAAQKEGIRLLLKPVEDASQYGVAETDGELVRRVMEKPSSPVSDLAVIGVYLYPSSVFDVIGRMTPSSRGELEVSELNNVYAKRGLAHYDIVRGPWADAGESPEALLRAGCLLAARSGVDMDSLIAS